MPKCRWNSPEINLFKQVTILVSTEIRRLTKVGGKILLIHVLKSIIDARVVKIFPHVSFMYLFCVFHDGFSVD